MSKSYKEEAERYQELSTIYQYCYEDLLEQMNTVVELQGVWIEIKSECIKYTKRTKKVAEQAETRLKIIDNAIKQFDYLLNEKFRQKEMIKRLTSKCGDLYYENQELKKQIEINEKLWNEEN